MSSTPEETDEVVGVEEALEVEPVEEKPQEAEPHVEKQYPRFRLMARIEHAILAISFTVLTVTGIPQKYALESWAQWMIGAMGGIEFIRIVHRYAAILLVVGSIYHLFTSAYRFFVKRERMRMLPVKKDWQDLVQTIKHNLGFTDEAPRMGKFNFGEKVEYWAVVWGTAIMAITGFMLWNPIAATVFLPGEFIPAAKAAHGGEALLAVLSILIWHMYNVHLKHFNPSMFTGNLPRHQMEEEHALELERLEAGGDPWPELALPVLRQRQRVFFAVSLVVGSLLLVALIWAFTFEETAVQTIPRVTREIFVPLGTPIP
ncbi:MAG: cytochrome b/b6 domain-containing protein [Anaerolineae bacterium]|nr:cytochrome b/b6 domain-containing protein [Anaerolineae bacterium]